MANTREKEQDVYVNYINTYKKIIPMEMKHNMLDKKKPFYKENASEDAFLDMVTSPFNRNPPRGNSGLHYSSPIKTDMELKFDSDYLDEDTKSELQAIFIEKLFENLSKEPTIEIRDKKEIHYVSEHWFCGCFFDGLRYSKIACEIFDKFSGEKGTPNKYSDDNHNKIVKAAWKKCSENIMKKINNSSELSQLLNILTGFQE